MKNRFGSFNIDELDIINDLENMEIISSKFGRSLNLSSMEDLKGKRIYYIEMLKDTRVNRDTIVHGRFGTFYLDKDLVPERAFKEDIVVEGKWSYKPNKDGDSVSYKDGYLVADIKNKFSENIRSISNNNVNTNKYKYVFYSNSEANKIIRKLREIGYTDLELSNDGCTMFYPIYYSNINKDINNILENEKLFKNNKNNDIIPDDFEI